jgi:hypothetical protein
MTYVVRRDRQDLFAELRIKSNESPDVAVILDRRVTERRRQPQKGTATNRRRVERRRYHPELQLLGWTVTRHQEAGPIALTAGELV